MSDLPGRKTIVMTGATSGIGKAAAIVFARRGFQLVMPSRDPRKAMVLREEIGQFTANAKLDFVRCDLNDLESVEKCGRIIHDRYSSIHLLINNAGTAQMKRRASVQGFERTFAVNHLSHFVLTAWLLPRLVRGARIVTTASEAQSWGKADYLQDINYEKHPYKVMDAYGNSKLANVLFANKLARTLETRGITSNSFHPGRIATDIWPHDNLFYRTIFALAKKIYLRPVAEGAKPLIKLALDPGLAKITGAFYFETKPRAPNALALDESLQDRLWHVSCRLAEGFLPKEFAESSDSG